MEYRPKLEPFEPVVNGGTGPTVQDVLVVDDHPLMCEVLSMTLSSAFNLRHVRTAASLAAAHESISSAGTPDAVVLDLNLPDVKGIEGVVAIKRWAPDTRLTLISAEIHTDMVAAIMSAGACGYIAKTMMRLDMIEAFRRMWNGEKVVPDSCGDDVDVDGDDTLELAQLFRTLTPQQMNILELICQGHPNKIIGYKLSIAEATVKTHISAIMTKINVRNRTQAALLASKARLFDR